MKLLKSILVLFISISITSCSSDDNKPLRSTLKLSLSGIEPLESGLVYEGWIMVDGTPVSTGRFNTKATETTNKEFSVLAENLDEATAFILSIEKETGDEPAPSNTKILSGNFIANAAALTINSMVGNFVDTTNQFSGSFVTATPTDNTDGIDNGNNEFGIWFIKNPTTAGLINLPTLSAGWKYEGWVIFDGTPATTGQFTRANGVDSASPYSGNEPAPLFPGEDFLSNLPAGVDGDVTGNKVVISIEPDFTVDSDKPFYFKPFGGQEGVNNNSLSITSNINVTISGKVTR